MKRLALMTVLTTLAALLVTPADALEYTFAAPQDYLFGEATSDATIYEWENPNVDRSKNVALVAPGFGTPTSYLPNSGEPLTPNLVTGSGSVVVVGGTSAIGTTEVVGGMGAVSYPTVSVGSTVQTTSFTDVTSDLYYSNGSLGTLKIPSIGLTVGVYEGTASAPLLKGAGHFTGTSIWNGNCCFAGHNRGVRNDFGKLHTLKNGATIAFTTKLGTRTYAVTSVAKISVNDTSGLAATAHNQLTLYTCVENQPAYRWCVKAVEIV